MQRLCLGVEVCGSGLVRVAPAGAIDRLIGMPYASIIITFGGADADTLYVTSMLGR